MFKQGDTVKVERVAFPELPKHAQDLGRTGIVKRVFKTTGLVRVEFPEGDTRDSFPANLSLVKEGD